MKKIILLILYFNTASTILLSQLSLSVIHFKKEGVSNNSVGKAYFVNTLTLKSDSTFILQSILFANKKERKNCILNAIEINYGNWFMDSDTIKCVIKEPSRLNGRIEKFLLYKRRIYYFTDILDLKKRKLNHKYFWKKINSLNSKILLKKVDKSI
jgi:hypothetical protein